MSPPMFYTDDELTRARPLTPRVVRRIRRNADLMRWADVEAIPGSLADVFWNKDMPRLLALAEASNQDRTPDVPDPAKRPT